MIGTLLQILGSLGVFLYGMRIMSDGLQKAAGNRLQSILNYMTRNPVSAVVTGFLITAVIQSSSATTVMVVSFANASLLTLIQSIGVIMGANIGTTVTTWIVSFFGFKFSISSIALPIIGLGFPLFFSKRKPRRDLAEIMIGFGFLFLGLSFLKTSVPDIQNNPGVLEFLRNFTEMGYWSYVIFILVGTALTMVVQSSSAAMAITVTMAYKGWIDFPIACAIVLGENIGTTITAHLASIGTSANARRAARAHFFFNVFGVFWMLFIFRQFIGFVDKITPFWDTANPHDIPLKLALFHTMFNLTNTIICLPFIKYLALFVEKWIKEKADPAHIGYQLDYISTGLQDTAQFNVLNAKSELKKMAIVTGQMFRTFLEIYQQPDKKLGNKIAEMADTEELTDQMQEEITRYLIECTKEDLSEIFLENVNAMLRIVNELENIADSCMKLTYLLQRRYDRKIELHPRADEEIMDFSKLILDFMSFYQEQMNKHIEKRALDIAFRLENKINLIRDNLKNSATVRLQEGGNVSSELLYMDLLKHFEHIGDNSLNIAQALTRLH
ncbi:MAG: Na/Pi cotransporter family protein [Candidatus Cloacimonetes bacterium]|nr:Na/Pi cotransporter family protein [Candidatus Cloacimonadota bacterium]